LILGELSKSSDVAVVGLTGAMIGPQNVLGQTLLRRAVGLNPKNPAWTRALEIQAPEARDMAAVQGLQIADLWPGGEVRPIALPPAAIRTDLQALVFGQRAAARDNGLVKMQTEAIIPEAAWGAGCSVRFEALVGRDGRIKDLQVIALDKTNIPFLAAERDGLRQVQYSPMEANGQVVEALTEIERKCPERPASVAPLAGVPGGVAGGVSGGTGAAAPPPPPPPISVRIIPRNGAPAQIAAAIQAAKLIKQIDPIYPPIAKQARIQGSVVLAATIGEDGTVQRLSVVSSANPLLTPAALDAVKQWVYAPTMINGEPVEVLTQVTVTFTLR
jgi:protein TonB